MNDWISSDKEDYIKKAIKFSNDLNLISNIRKNLRNTILKSPIFDHETLGENFDKLIKNIWLKYLKK
jgi:protein O-GlcNAc transferase